LPARCVQRAARLRDNSSTKVAEVDRRASI
jgi:hypothetical protein